MLRIVYYLTSAGSVCFRTSSKNKKISSWPPATTTFFLFLLRVRKQTLPARVKYDTFLNECVESTSMHCFLGRTNLHHCTIHVVSVFAFIIKKYLIFRLEIKILLYYYDLSMIFYIQLA